MGYYTRYLKWMYRSGRPNWVARPQNRLGAWVNGFGLWPSRLGTLEVRGRRSGKNITFPVVIADWQGEEFLVSMLGEQANWVKNVRAARGKAVLRRGRTATVRLDEVPVEQRPAIIKRYVAVAPGGRPHLGLAKDASLDSCAAIAAATPVFRIVDPSVA